jgi:hypothetical protein
MSKNENSKKLSLKKFNILYNKLKFLLKAEGDCCKRSYPWLKPKKNGFPFYIFFILNTYLYVFFN